MKDKVKVYDLDSEQVTEIPEAELAPGMVQAEVEGVGLVWINAAKARQAEHFRHEPFSDEMRSIISEIREKLDEVYPMTLKQWEDGFRLDIDPEREIAIWTHIAQVYEQCLKEFRLVIAQRKELFGVIVACANSPRESVLTVTQVSRIAKDQAERAIALFFEWNKSLGRD